MSDAEAPGQSEEPLPQGARHPLGIGSKFSVSADGRLQGPSCVSLAQASEGWTEASGAVQGVSPLLSTTEGRTASDSISDALMLSRNEPKSTRTKLYSIFDETDLASGRGDFESADLDRRIPPPFLSSVGAPSEAPPLTEHASAVEPRPLSALKVPELPRRAAERDEEKKQREKPKNEAQIKREKHLLAQIKARTRTRTRTLTLTLTRTLSLTLTLTLNPT